LKSEESIFGSSRSVLSDRVIRYGIVEFNVPLDTVYVILETEHSDQTVVTCTKEIIFVGICLFASYASNFHKFRPKGDTWATE